jgi:ribose transport system permease protein
MKKVLGVLGVLVAVCIFTSAMNPNFLSPFNVENILQRTAMLGILAIGSAFVIMAGGIDLSIGSLVGLLGCLLALTLTRGWPVPAVLLLMFALALGVGLLHGVLITKLRLQPFVVTLCGLLIYRGAARWLTGDREYGLPDDFRGLVTERLPVPGIENFGIPVPFLILVGLAVVAGVFLNRTIWGRYLLAVGRNEQAARYSGINTDAITIMAYVLCSGLTGLGAVLYAMYQPSIQPAGHGEFLELYAIAAAVLGGCSLRGGEGSILGVVLGTALIPVLYNASNVLRMPTQLEFAIIGVVIIIGVIVDELVKRFAAARRRRRGAGAAGEERAAARVV